MIFSKVKTYYGLNKSRKLFRQIYRHFRRKQKGLISDDRIKIESHLNALRLAILEKNNDAANRIAHQLQDLIQKTCPKTWFDRVIDFIGAVAFALALAICIRQMWFELFVIPTGSMRPTLKEDDFLLVSKTSFGINVPLTTAHFHFESDLVDRGSIVIFTGEHMDIPDADTVYFYLFPGKKLFVKRLIGKPGDSLYFYGGAIYGVNRQGEDLEELRATPWFRQIEHIPYIRFDGKIEAKLERTGIYSPVTFYQMNQPVAKLQLGPFGNVTGEMLQKAPQYSDLWGFGNFAMARLLTAEEAQSLYPSQAKELLLAPLYLELKHHPSITDARMIRDEMGRLRPDLGSSTSLLPLQQEQIDAIATQMTTCRFIVENGYARRFGFSANDPFFSRYYPKLPNVPDGTYEIQNGSANQVYWGGITKELPKTDPLFRTNPAQVQTLYNLGIEFLTQYNPAKERSVMPSRYAYFREGDLYLMGVPIIYKDNPNLIRFINREYEKQSMSTSVRPYTPFDDQGPPFKADGSLDVEFIRRYGITIPDKMYLVLGDNHAMSADSRQFGFVPEQNLKGKATLLFWPPGPRWGRLPQPSGRVMTLPNLIIWGAAAALMFSTSVYLRRRLQKPLV
ncbi:MAG: putative signal peptidase [Chlamydiota bacterium]